MVRTEMQAGLSGAGGWGKTGLSVLHSPWGRGRSRPAGFHEKTGTGAGTSCLYAAKDLLSSATLIS